MLMNRLFRLTRRSFLAGAGLSLAVADRSRSLILVKESDAGRMRDFVRRDRAGLVEELADRALAAGPWSVSYHRPAGLNVEAGPNDYVSEGPYWWPDPKNPKGPYIRKDGVRNPDRFMGNRSDLGNMCTAVLALGMGALLANQAGCAEHAGRILSVWFLDPRTRMNPNLEYGQMVRGVNAGRGTGIIDTVSLIHVAQGMALLEMAGGLNSSVSAGMRRWFADYLKWMTASRKGLSEKSSGNNHATWWTAQAAAYAALVDDAPALAMAWNHYRDYLVPAEIRPDGSCPREEERTDSLGYSSMNLDAFAVVCRLAQAAGVDLWHYQTPQGISIEKSFYYLIPYVLRPETWKKQQIGAYNANGCFFPGLAGLGLSSVELLSAYYKLPRAGSPWIQFIDILVRSAAG